jgi:hypothetical protein
MALAHLAANRQSETIGVYSVGFLDAAVALFARANEGRGMVDLTFYPAAYCLRHGVELLVKQLSVLVAYELRDPKLLYEPGHDLAAAWEPIKAYVEEVTDADALHGDNELPHHLDVLTGMVEELHDLDLRGTLLRYPEFVKSGKGARPREREDTHIPFDDVNLDDWLATAEATLAAAQALRWSLESRADYIRSQRGEPPVPFADLVIPPKR